MGTRSASARLASLLRLAPRPERRRPSPDDHGEPPGPADLPGPQRADDRGDASGHLRVEVIGAADGGRVVVSGAITTASRQFLRRPLDAASAMYEHLTLDLSAVSFVDQSVLRDVVADVRRHQVDRDGTLEVVGAPVSSAGAPETLRAAG